MVCKKDIHIFKGKNGFIGVVGGDFLSWIQNKINPPEMHLPGYQYCGPFTKLEKRLQRGDAGINRVDKACKKHDIEYSKTTDRHVADQEFLEDLDAIQNPTVGERIAKSIIKPIIKAKKTFGLGIYCVKCKEKTDTRNYQKTISKNNRSMAKGFCAVCGSKKNVFL